MYRNCQAETRPRRRHVVKCSMYTFLGNRLLWFKPLLSAHGLFGCRGSQPRQIVFPIISGVSSANSSTRQRTRHCIKGFAVTATHPQNTHPSNNQPNFIFLLKQPLLTMNFFAIFTMFSIAIASASATALDGRRYVCFHHTQRMTANVFRSSFETTGELTERGCVCSGGCAGGAICCQDPCGCGHNC